MSRTNRRPTWCKLSNHRDPSQQNSLSSPVSRRATRCSCSTTMVQHLPSFGTVIQTRILSTETCIAVFTPSPRPTWPIHPSTIATFCPHHHRSTSQTTPSDTMPPSPPRRTLTLACFGVGRANPRPKYVHIICSAKGKEKLVSNLPFPTKGAWRITSIRMRYLPSSFRTLPRSWQSVSPSFQTWNYSSFFSKGINAHTPAKLLIAVTVVVWVSSGMSCLSKKKKRP